MPAPVPSQFGQPPDLPAVGAAFARFCEVIAQLRSPTGCPWDRQQTLETIKPFTLEETYELLEAIDSQDDTAIVEELGDVLLQVVLDAQIGRDEQRFGIEQVLEIITRKMIERHPHVFDTEKAHTADEVLTNWDRAKQREKKRDSIFDGLPAALPALARCARVSEKAARVGYDFPHRAMLFDKLREEIDELAHELFTDGQIPQIAASVEMAPVPDEPVSDAAQRDRIESEFGDVLFVVANLARRWKINPEEALRRSNAKFERRVRFIEEALRATGRSIRDATLQEMEELYQAGKRQEKDVRQATVSQP